MLLFINETTRMDATGHSVLWVHSAGGERVAMQGCLTLLPSHNNLEHHMQGKASSLCLGAHVHV